MDLSKASFTWRTIVFFAALLVIGSCTQQKSEQTGTETAVSQKIEEKTNKETLQKEPAEVSERIDELFVELRKHQSNLRAREQTLEKIAEELDGKDTSLSNRAHELRMKEIELLERENQVENEEGRLKAQERFSFIVLGFGVIMILIGGVMLTVSMGHKSRVKTTEKEKVNAKGTKPKDYKKRKNNSIVQSKSRSKKSIEKRTTKTSSKIGEPKKTRV